MLSSAKIGTGSWRYYTAGVACRASDYYLGVGEAPGRWHGRGLEQLGLAPGSVVMERELEALFARGLHPSTGSRLGRAWRTDGVTGFDLTFSAPKSVSALWALGDSSTAAAAMAAHRAAVRAGLAYLDTHASLSRRGTDGVEQISSAGLVAAVFDHRSSRAGDPQLHTHALVLNKVRCADDRWRTLDATEMYHHKKSAGMIYQAALRNELHERLGVRFREVNQNGQADIAGVPDALLELWSKRTATIDAEAAPKIAQYEKLLGRTMTAAERAGVVKTAVLKTRARKQHPELSALHATWTAEAARAGWTPERLRRSTGLRRSRVRTGQDKTNATDGVARPAGPPEPAGADLADAAWSGPHAAGGFQPAEYTMDDATTWAFDAVAPQELATAALQAAGARRAVFSRADVAGQVAAHLPTGGLSASEVVERVEQLTDLTLGLQDAVQVTAVSNSVTARASDGRYATVQVLTAEARVLDLAARGRRVGYGQVAYTAVMAAGRDRRLDPSQARAVLHLAGGGDFLSVLTAPAGAGKTSTLGAAARAWHDAGYRVVGLAPSARAAAELATATGEPADTLAKWLHTHHGSPAGAHGTALDDRTVVIVDEASMASTLDLDPLVTAAGKAGTKVVLVGDPAQIGVVNGPGGMLAALATAGHGVDLAEIHRFSALWERHASLALRHGRPTALDQYGNAGRLHACQDGDAALDAVFAHWAAARADGQDALMLARTRLDVDALNERARAAAVAGGQVTGPVTVAGGRQWQAGDVLRARRNDRRLVVWDGHVRNGDRFQVLGPGPEDGLIVEELTGRGRTVLPADYLSQHAEYGWASTIDAAQGATADVGIVLVRPGMDREHLYVAMTRGRHGNHAYVTPDLTDDDDHHGHTAPRPAEEPVRSPQEQAVQVLEDALRSSGAQDAVHTALEHARAEARARAQAQAGARAAQTAGQQRAAEQAAALDAAEAQRRRWHARPLTPEHTRAVQLLDACRAERDTLRTHRDALHSAVQQTRAQLEQLPRWAYRRRRDLTDSLATGEQQLRRTDPTWATLDADIDRLTRELDHHTRQREASDRPAQHRVRHSAWNPTRSGPPTQAGATQLDAHELVSILTGREPYRGPEPDRADGLQR